MEYLTWTYYFRRLLMNPSYYGLEATDEHAVNAFLSLKVSEAINSLVQAGCIHLADDGAYPCDSAVTVFNSLMTTGTIESLTNGRIASYYYLRHTTLRLFSDELSHDLDVADLLKASSGLVISMHTNAIADPSRRIRIR